MTTAEARTLARTAGLRDLRPPALEDVDRRRLQLWLLSLLVALAIPAAAVAVGAGWMPGEVLEGFDLRNLRLVLLALMVVVLGYVAERETTLRRLSRLLVEERVLTASLVGRVDELNLLLRATRAMNSSLDLARVLDLIAASALQLLDAAGIAILMVATDDRKALEVVAATGSGMPAVGARQPIGEGLVGSVVSRRDALLVLDGQVAPGHRTVGTGLLVPLEVRGELVGVVHVTAAQTRERFTEFDLRSTSVFADAAAGAITNARAHTATQARIAELLEHDREKDEFLTLVTHELRTPLTSVIGLLSTIARRPDLPAADVVEYAEIARQQGWRLDRLIDNILQASRVGQDALAIEPETVDVAAALERAVTGFRQADLDRTITLETPPHLVRRVDPEALSRIVDNLVGNAVKYSPPGTAVHVEARAEGEDSIRLVVRDEGPGVRAEHLEHVFARFARSDDPQHAGGLGLGLFVVRALAEAHGGFARAATEPTGGARFDVVLAGEPPT